MLEQTEETTESLWQLTAHKTSTDGDTTQNQTALDAQTKIPEIRGNTKKNAAAVMQSICSPPQQLLHI